MFSQTSDFDIFIFLKSKDSDDSAKVIYVLEEWVKCENNQ